jgi:hypothetical protein
MKLLKFVKLEDIAEIISGQIFTRVISYDKDDSININVIRDSYIKKGYLITPNDSYNNINISKSKLNNNKLYLTKRFTKVDDIVVSLKYPFSASLISKYDSNKLIDSYSLIIRIKDDIIDKYYLLSYLNSKYCKNSILELCNNNENVKDIKTVSLKTYKITKIPLLESKFEELAIGKSYKETLDKIKLFKRILYLELEINNKKFEEIIGAYNDKYKED